MSIIEYPTYCINLEKCSKRKKIMENQFKKYNINYTFCKAIDANDISFEYKKDNKIQQEIKGHYKKNGLYFKIHVKGKSMWWKTSNGWLGCVLSHLIYLMKASQKKEDIICMLEDDISFQYYNKWKKSIKSIVENAPKDWSILKLHCSNVHCLKTLIKSKNPYINITNMTINDKLILWSSGFYIVNKQGMKEILNKFYDKKNNCLNLFCDYPVADGIIYEIPGVYYYSIPLVKNNNNEFGFASTIESNTTAELKGIRFVEEYYKNIKPYKKAFLLFNHNHK